MRKMENDYISEVQIENMKLFQNLTEVIKINGYIKQQEIQWNYCVNIKDWSTFPFENIIDLNNKSIERYLMVEEINKSLDKINQLVFDFFIEECDKNEPNVEGLKYCFGLLKQNIEDSKRKYEIKDNLKQKIIATCLVVVGKIYVDSPLIEVLDLANEILVRL